MIYMKAKVLEDAYWGYDVEEHWDQNSDSGDDRSSDESRRQLHTHPLGTISLNPG